MGMNIALPCRVSVYTEEGKTKIAMARPTQLLGALSDSANLESIAKGGEDKMIAMISDAV